MPNIEDEYLAAAKNAAIEAGKEILGGLQDKDKEINYKGDIDLVTKMDFRSEEIIKGVLTERFPDISILAEEGGTFLNGEKLSVSDTGLLKKSLLATGFPYDRATSSRNNLDNFGAFLMKCQGIRRMGSAALDLCYTAAGRFDGYWEMKLNPWDIAAGVLILTEAGGAVSDFAGRRFSVYGKEILASNGRIHKEMTDVFKEL